MGDQRGLLVLDTHSTVAWSGDLSRSHRSRSGRCSHSTRGTEYIERRHNDMTMHELFTTETAGLVQVLPAGLVRPHDGDRFDRRITPIPRYADIRRKIGNS